MNLFGMSVVFALPISAACAYFGEISKKLFISVFCGYFVCCLTLMITENSVVSMICGLCAYLIILFVFSLPGGKAFKQYGIIMHDFENDAGLVFADGKKVYAHNIGSGKLSKGQLVTLERDVNGLVFVVPKKGNLRY